MNEIGKEPVPDKIFLMDRVHNQHPDPENRTYKYLGILLDENLSLNAHFDYLCKKLSKGLFCLNRGKHYLDTKALKNLYFSLFHPHLLYCTLIFGCTSDSNIKLVLIMQKKAVRIISNKKYNDHTAPLFIQHSILPFDKLLYFNKIKFIHSYVHGHCANSLGENWLVNTQRTTNITLRNNDDLTVPFPRFEGFKKFPNYDFPHLWNKIGPMKYQSNTTTFTTWLKNLIFTELAELSNT